MFYLQRAASAHDKLLREIPATWLQIHPSIDAENVDDMVGFCLTGTEQQIDS